MLVLIVLTECGKYVELDVVLFDKDKLKVTVTKSTFLTPGNIFQPQSQSSENGKTDDDYQFEIEVSLTTVIVIL